MATIPIITSYLKNIYSISEPLILYRSNPKSITSLPQASYIDDIIYAMKCISDIYKKANTKKVTSQVLAPSMKSAYSLIRTVSRQIYGYYFFNKKQRKEIKLALAPFRKEFKTSLQLKIIFIGLFGVTSRIKKSIKNNKCRTSKRFK